MKLAHFKFIVFAVGVLFSSGCDTIQVKGQVCYDIPGGGSVCVELGGKPPVSGKAVVPQK